MIVVVEADALSQEALRGAAGPGSLPLPDLDAARRRVEESDDVTVVLIGPQIDLAGALALSEELRLSRPMVGVVLVRARIDTQTLTDALRAGVREVVKERDIDGVAAAVQRAISLSNAVREQAGLVASGGDGPPKATLVTVFSAKGGAGKTTLSTNLAAALADGGRREVCLVDLDLAFGDVAIALQLFPAHTLSDAVPMMDSLDEAAVSALLTPHSPGLTTLVAPVEPGAAESIPAPLVGRVLRVLKQMFEYVVVDTPPAFTDHVLAAFDESDYVALLATLDIPALKNLKLTLETLDLLNYPRERWRVVLNRADSKVGLALSEVEKTLRVPIAAQIPSSRSVPASINRGVPIVLDEPNHPVSIAIRAFGEKEIVGTSAVKLPPAALRTDNRRFSLRRKEKSS
ncbi:MAG TPA: AAA family ATPase [Frankiaceae bacterium]|nr:AAA family ATPase [Frankiaceae bacterium]